MAGKGGGAWKVAYADFVTAMMAFFLVMWITAQDPKVKEEIENYFAAPLGYTPFGEPTHASTGGAVESLSSGNIPSNEAVEMGRGRAHHADIRSDQRATEIVIDWLQMQPAVLTYWKGHAQRILDQTEERHSAEGAPSLHESAAVAQLARLLRAELHQQVPVEDQGIYRDLLQEALADVDWKSVASAILRDCPIVSAPREELGHGNRATSVKRGESEFSQG